MYQLNLNYMRRKEFIKKLGVAGFMVPVVTSVSCNDDEIALPDISLFSPVSGTEGTVVTIAGVNFSKIASENSVYFNGTEATVSASTKIQLTTTVPVGATSGFITVKVKGKSAISDVSFEVTEVTAESPVISGFSPTSGEVGDSVTISGSNFGESVSTNVVTINGAVAEISSASSNEIVAIIPSGGTSVGKITVTANGAMATSSGDFTIEDDEVSLSILSFTSSGSAGSTIAIIGTGFSTTASENVVTIGGVTATVSAATETQLMVVVPINAVSGVITVTVSGSKVTSSTSFTVVAAACVATDSETAGPFPTKDPASLLRQNITSDRTGVPFSVVITILDMNSSCAALEGALVDIWHCDKDGYYSEYGGTSMQQIDFTSVHFLRGRQVTNSNGMVSFTSIFPGWYQSRATHIHVHIYDKNGNSLLVTQIGFPEGTNSAVNLVNAATAYGYTKGMSGYTYNANDNVFSDSADSEIGVVSGSVDSGYSITHTIIVK